MFILLLIEVVVGVVYELGSVWPCSALFSEPCAPHIDCARSFVVAMVVYIGIACIAVPL